MPEPNVSWGWSPWLIVMSNVSGSVNTSASLFASARPMPTNVPAGNTTSRYSMSSLAKRAVPRTAPK